MLWYICLDTGYCALSLTIGVTISNMPYDKKRVYIILHNIRSIHNVGSIFRTADAIGVTRIYLTGYTPAPIDRFGRARKDFSKASLGAEKSMQWEKRKNISALLLELKKGGTQIIAVEQSAHSIDYKKVRAKASAAVVLGNEVTGIPLKVLELCDCIAEIPMRGRKESLNVSVSAGVALFRFFDCIIPHFSEKVGDCGVANAAHANIPRYR